MTWYICIVISVFIVGYLVGSNNPLPSVKKKIIDSVTNKKD